MDYTPYTKFINMAPELPATAPPPELAIINSILQIKVNCGGDIKECNSTVTKLAPWHMTVGISREISFWLHYSCTENANKAPIFSNLLRAIIMAPRSSSSLLTRKQQCSLRIPVARDAKERKHEHPSPWNPSPPITLHFHRNAIVCTIGLVSPLTTAMWN